MPWGIDRGLFARQSISEQLSPSLGCWMATGEVERPRTHRPGGFRRVLDGATWARTQQELREKVTAPEHSRTHPREGLVHWRGCHPHPSPFPWLKVVKVWRCVRVRRNLLVLPSSTRRVNAFVGDLAFWEHQSPRQSHPLQSWLDEPWSPLGDGTERRGHVGHQAPQWGQGRRLCQRHSWTGSPWVLQRHWKTERVLPSPA